MTPEEVREVSRELSAAVVRCRVAHAEALNTYRSHEIDHVRVLYPHCFAERDGYLFFDPPKGTTVEWAVAAASVVASAERRTVRLRFNGRAYPVDPDGTCDYQEVQR